MSTSRNTSTNDNWTKTKKKKSLHFHKLLHHRKCYLINTKKKTVFCNSTTNRLKIQTSSPDFYRTVVRFLREEKAEFDTFQLNKNKPTHVVLRNLHPSTPTALIKSELEIRLFEVRQVTQVIHRLHKHPLHSFSST